MWAWPAISFYFVLWLQSVMNAVTWLIYSSRYKHVTLLLVTDIYSYYQSQLECLPQRVTLAPSLPLFRGGLKTYIFSLSFPWLWSAHAVTRHFIHFNCSFIAAHYLCKGGNVFTVLACYSLRLSTEILYQLQMIWQMLRRVRSKVQEKLIRLWRWCFFWLWELKYKNLMSQTQTAIEVRTLFIGQLLGCSIFKTMQYQYTRGHSGFLCEPSNRVSAGCGVVHHNNNRTVM